MSNHCVLFCYCVLLGSKRYELEFVAWECKVTEFSMNWARESSHLFLFSDNAWERQSGQRWPWYTWQTHVDFLYLGNKVNKGRCTHPAIKVNCICSNYTARHAVFVRIWPYQPNQKEGKWYFLLYDNGWRKINKCGNNEVKLVFIATKMWPFISPIFSLLRSGQKRR